MGVREEAIANLQALWPDAGVGVLKRAGLAADWTAVVGPIPDELLAAPGDAQMAGQTVLGRLRDLYRQAGRSREALAFARAGADRARQHFGGHHPQALLAAMHLGVLLDRLDRTDEALPHLFAAWAGLVRAYDNAHIHVASSAAAYGRALRRAGDPVAAEARLSDALKIRRLVTPGKTGLLAAQVAELRIETDRDDEAAPLLQEAWESLCRDKGEHDRLALDRARTLSSLWLRLDEHARAVPVFQSLWAWVQPNGSAVERAQVGFDLGRCLDATARPEQGLRLMDEALRITRTLEGEDGAPHPDLPQRLATWARVSEDRGRRQEAEGYLLEAIEAEKQIFGEQSAQVGIRQAAVGDLVYRMGRLDEAIGWIDSGLSLVRSALGDEHELSALVTERLIDLLLEKADQCFEVLDDPETGWEYVYRGQWLCLDILGPDHPAHKTLKYYRNSGG